MCGLKDRQTEGKVLVYGTGKSGIAACRYLVRHGADVWVYDERMDLDKVTLAGAVGNGFSESRIVTGDLSDALLLGTVLCIVSPGVPLDQPAAVRIRRHGIPIISEVELAFCHGKGELIGITGTNGKTTTTALTGHILREAGRDVRVVGNIGIPYIDEADTLTDDSVCVAELSSFQLEAADRLRPHISAILNITPDHLNRHHTMEAYIKAKEKITARQNEQDYCILNYEDPYLQAFAGELSGRFASPAVVWFSSASLLETGAWLEEGTLYIRLPGWREKEKICHVDDLQLLGRHNHENVMAACLAAALAGVPAGRLGELAGSFGGVPHRIEYVDEVGGVAFYNDSKGTNPDAAIRGIRAMKRPTVLIGGGYDKDSSYEEWIKAFDGKVRQMVLVGQTKEKIAQCAASCGFTNVLLCDTFEEAFEAACDAARAGDAVLLSPACASWGMFDNYEQRGDVFKALVAKKREDADK